MIARENVPAMTETTATGTATATSTAIAAGAASWSFASRTAAMPSPRTSSAAGMDVVPGSGMIVVQRYEYTGRELASESDGYYFRYRVYGPALGQFFTRDPLGYFDGMGLYAGVLAQQQSADPLGLKPIWCNRLEGTIRGFLTTPQDIRAWNNFVGGTGVDIELTTDETESVVYSSKEFKKALAALDARCDYKLIGPPEEWKELVQPIGSTIGEPWNLSIGGTKLKLASTCQCRCLWFKVAVLDYYDFDPKFLKTHRALDAELKTIAVGLAQAVSFCGWKEFYHKGFTHGKLGSGCGSFE